MAFSQLEKQCGAKSKSHSVQNNSQQKCECRRGKRKMSSGSVFQLLYTGDKSKANVNFLLKMKTKLPICQR